jgi:hypothetical protein
MNNLTKKYSVILTIMAVIAIIAFAALHVSCHSGASSICLLTVCAFILTSFSVPFLAGVNPLLVNIPARHGVSITFRLERPPRI